MDSLNVERMESQDQLPQTEKGTTFLRTCFNGLNALSGFNYRIHNTILLYFIT